MEKLIPVWKIDFPLKSLVFGVRDSQSVQKTSALSLLSKTNVFMRLKCILTPFCTHERCYMGLFLRIFRPNIWGSFDFLAEL